MHGGTNAEQIGSSRKEKKLKNGEKVGF